MNDDEPIGSRRARQGIPEPVTLSAALESATSRPGPAFDSQGKGAVTTHHEFNLNYVDKRRNLHWTGKFKCHVPSIAETITMGKVLSALRGNVPAIALDDTTVAITEMLATLTVLLDEAPPWASGNALQQIYDQDLLVAIYKEVRDHIARFWGAPAVGTGGGGGGEIGAAG